MYFCNFIKIEFQKSYCYQLVFCAIFSIKGKANFYSLVKKIFAQLQFDVSESFKNTFYFYEKNIKNAYIFQLSSINNIFLPKNISESAEIVITDDNNQDGVIPYSCIPIQDPTIKDILPKYNSIYLESSWDNVHKVPFPKELSSGIRVIKGFILPDGSYSCYNLPFFEFEIRSEVLSQIITLLEKDGFVDMDISNICLGLYKIIVEGVHSRQLLIVVDSLTKLPQVQFDYLNHNIRIKITDELAKSLDGIEIMIWYYENNKSKHYLRLGSIINGDKSLDEVRLRLR